MRLSLVAAALAALCCSAHAQGRGGDFDFYVLSLSWSPSYCAAEGARADKAQCSGERPYEFVVHGLWPQYERGYPESCNRSAPRAPRQVIDNMLDIMPSKGLINHQWRKHGTCATSDPSEYLSSVREARDAISIPKEYVNVTDWKLVRPNEVERAFIAANPGLPADGIAVTCDSRHLREVHICLTQNFGFRSCPETDRRTCRATKVAMPPSR